MNYRRQLSLHQRARNSFKRRKERILRWKNDRRRRKLISELHFQEEDALLIFSEARGGSTWLMELLSQLPGACTMWEPLHKVRGVVPSEFRFCENPELGKSDDNQDYKDFFSALFSFETSNAWTRRFLSKEQLGQGTFSLIKFVRANLLLDWIMAHYQFKKKPIILSRHPLDTCISQIKSFPANNLTKIPDCANNGRYQKHQSLLANCEDELEARFVLWCLNNVPIYAWLERQNEIIWVEYGDLLRNAENEVQRIYTELGFGSESSELIEKNDLNKRSFTSLSSKDIDKPEIRLQHNFLELDTRKKDRLQAILDHFGFVHYSMDSPFPKQ